MNDMPKKIFAWENPDGNCWWASEEVVEFDDGRWYISYEEHRRMIQKLCAVIHEMDHESRKSREQISALHMAAITGDKHIYNIWQEIDD